MTVITGDCKAKDWRIFTEEPHRIAADGGTWLAWLLIARWFAKMIPLIHRIIGY